MDADKRRRQMAELDEGIRVSMEEDMTKLRHLR
jgi:hypothetical protein